jgi:putative peptide zinc metalloprotease protein
VAPPHGSPSASVAGAPAELPIPTRAAGVELVGEMRGSGYRNPPALVRRGDGQTIQLTPLLYRVLAEVDGRRTYEQVAVAVSERLGRELTAADACFLIETKLRPLGLLRRPDGTDPEVARANPLLALKLKYVVTDPDRTARYTAPFAALFRTSVVVPVLAVFAASVWWIMFHKGLAGATHEAFQDPRLLLTVVGLTLLSAGFHEFGHAAACRYGGARPGAMGAGLYLVWPAFYTEVTDSYRLGRWGRLRVDLGGLYFNAVFAVAIMGAWSLTGWDALLLVVATQVLQMVRQLTPLVRFDGYHILADLTGVPDLFHHIKPTLLSVLPHRWGRPEHRVLKPWARIVVTLWVAVVVPVLLAILVILVLILPTLLATAWEGFGTQREVLAQNWADGELAQVGVRVLSMLTLTIPALSVAYLLSRIARRAWRRAAAMTSGRFGRKVGAVTAVLFMLAGLAWAWWPGERYTPIDPAVDGTVQDLFFVALPTPDDDEGEKQDGSQVVDSARTRGTAQSPAAGTHRSGVAGPPQVTPVRDGPRPRPAVGTAGPLIATTAAVPPPSSTWPAIPGRAAAQRGGPPDGRATEPAWPFPWEPPAAPGSDDNQALAVATRDGSRVYDVALDAVWVRDGRDVTSRNESWALASCIDCTATAAPFQAVYVVGNADVYVPVNSAVAVTYGCGSCVTEAVSVQLVVTLTEEPSPRVRAQLTRVQSSLRGLTGQVRALPVGEVYARLKAAEAEILTILAAADLLDLGRTTSATDREVGDGRAELELDTPAVNDPSVDGPHLDPEPSSTGDVEAAEADGPDADDAAGAEVYAAEPAVADSDVDRPDPDRGLAASDGDAAATAPDAATDEDDAAGEPDTAGEADRDPDDRDPAATGDGPGDP